MTEHSYEAPRNVFPESTGETSEYWKTFTIKQKVGAFSIEAADVIYFRAEGNYIHLKLKDRDVRYRMTLNGVESKLDPSSFMRIHRRYIVNMEHVQSARYSGNNEFILNMANNERIVSGRTYRDRIRNFLTD